MAFNDIFPKGAVVNNLLSSLKTNKTAKTLQQCKVMNIVMILMLYDVGMNPIM